MGFMDAVKKWFGTAKEQAGEMTEKAKDVAEDLGEKAKPMVDKAKDVAEDAWDKAKDVADDVKDRFDGDDDEGEAKPAE